MRKKMFRPFLCAVLSALTCAAPVLADDALNNFYIVDDSDSRYLTRDELWEWQYDALGYIYNEIFARHGRPFRPGERYDLYFRAQAWYEPDPNYHFGLLNAVEQANEALVHQVLQEMRDQKTANPNGKPLPRSEADVPENDQLDFRSYELTPGQRLDVYTGPGSNFFRAANGKASVSTNESIKFAGEENGWAAIEYEVGANNRRIGYVNLNQVKDKMHLRELELLYDSGLTITECILTDEPDGSHTAIATLKPLTEIVLLGRYLDRRNGDWAYIDVQTEAGLVRGFVDNSCVTGSPGEYLKDLDDGGNDSAYDWVSEDAYMETRK